MKNYFYLLFLTSLLAPGVMSQTFPSYYSTTDLSLTSPGALKSGLFGYDNPAMLTYQHQPDLQFVWTDATGRWNDFNRWGLFTAAPNFGFGVVETKVGSFSVTDYRLSSAFGDRRVSFGLGFGFSGGDKSAFDRRNVWTLGTLLRPDPHFSLGLVGSATSSGGKTEAVADLGIRPFGNERLTLFADYGIQNDWHLNDGNWSYGAVVEALPGIRVTGRCFNTHAFSFGISFSLGNAGISGQSTFDPGGKHSFNTYALRLGAYDRTLGSSFNKSTTYVEMNLQGTMKYQRFMFFDHSNTLRNTLAAIEAARDDETVAGIAINTSGMSVNREMLWELREQLATFKSAGKKVIVFMDRPSMEAYHFATVADKIVLDPAGMVLLPGYMIGRTFLKGTLEKLGIGYDEWRFFTYKSAMEYLSRDSMSAADREQNKRYIDDLYALAKANICAGRKLTPERFDEIMNNEFMILPEDAISKGLVDTIGRWDDVKTMVERFEGRKKVFIGPATLSRSQPPPDHKWGEPPHIALIYAIGECAMDVGIKARTLVKYVEAAGNDPGIKAIIMRVDSPGGDAMASDYIAEAMKKAKKNKPVIVSQGYVAGSGGYWLSMYADTIVSAPSTITGSIGVIGGWMYNTGLKEKLGMTTDHVQIGNHADLGFGFALPFLGVGLPDRNFTAEERAAAEHALRSVYADFVKKVAEGRKATSDRIEPIARGRFYSGTEARGLGLVDVIGGLEDALRIAKQRANIDVNDEVAIVEMPDRGWFDFRSLMPRPFQGSVVSVDPVIEQLTFRLQHNGEPMPLMPIDQIDIQAPRE